MLTSPSNSKPTKPRLLDQVRRFGTGEHIQRTADGVEILLHDVGVNFGGFDVVVGGICIPPSPLTSRRIGLLSALLPARMTGP